jgi:hypothetical protein
MTKDKVISELCELASYVGEDVFKNQIAHDCFCSARNNISFHFSPEIISYIRDAIYEKINNDRRIEVSNNDNINQVTVQNTNIVCGNTIKK